MIRASVICCFALLVAISLIPSSLGCGEDCPGDCENKYQCVDRSEICEKMKHECENFFFRKCMRCACPKTCGVCSNGSSSSEEETTSTTLNTTTSTMSTPSTSTPSTSTPSYTEEPVTEEPSTEEPSSSSPSSEEPPSSSSPEPSTSVEPTTPPEEPSTTVEEISDAEFSDPTKMKCKSCDAKRKKLAEIYDKYYPK